MTAKLSAITLLAALTTAATAQTTAPKPATTAHHTATTAKSTTPPNIPKVVGVPKTLYALRYIDTKIGTGPLAEPSILGASPADSKIFFYTVHYTGWLTDGTKFDSSYDHPGAESFTFAAGAHRVIPGWDSGFEGMHVGGKRRLFIPYQLAYGEAGPPPRFQRNPISSLTLNSSPSQTPRLLQRRLLPPNPRPVPPHPSRYDETRDNPASSEPLNSSDREIRCQ